MHLCNDSIDWTDFSSSCVRQSWAALVPAMLVVSLVIVQYGPVKWSGTLPWWFRRSFVTFFPIEEAEILNLNSQSSEEELYNQSLTPWDSRWKKPVLCFFSLVQALWWAGAGSYTLIGDGFAWNAVTCYITSATWIYAILSASLRPVPTAPFDLLALFLLQLCAAFLMLGSNIYVYVVLDMHVGPTSWILTSSNVGLVVLLVCIVLSMPMAIPGKGVDRTKIGSVISPEDYCSLWDWMTFHWVYALISKGRNVTLNESDVWNLSLTKQSELLFHVYTNTPATTLARKIWACNARDITYNVLLASLSCVLLYTGPFFLNQILMMIDDPEPTAEKRAEAYISALLMFAFSLVKIQIDVQHLWCCRRAITRIRTELMAAIYDKSLKRKDFSGIVSKADTKDDPTEGGEPKAGADTGKIVNLMATDAKQVSQLFDLFYFLFTAPLELVIGTVFLFQLLGISALVGFLILIVSWPFSSMIVKRSVSIQKGIATARDSRMGVLTELIGAIKLIKFFAWEEQWVKNAMDKRNVEMKWMIKSRLNELLMYATWTIPPIVVSITSFLAYVALGNKLTVSTAFTSIALFNMIRIPLTLIPSNILRVLQTKVSLDRIVKFLEEDEVTEQISTLKQLDDCKVRYEGLGLEDATFKWNEVEPQSVDADRPVGKVQNGTDNATTAAVGDSSSVHSRISTVSDETAGRFELRNVNVLFPEGELTVVTGPTASGKTALLMAVLGELTLLSGRIILTKDTTKLLPSGFMQSISYAAQSPWLRHQSIRDNIIFESEWDEDRYQQVVECCALKPDFDVLEDGDHTEIGAKGVSLSGGQKARVALARAVYARTQYVLLDDPLSAVDSHTSRFLYDRLFCGPFLKGRTVVLVTHHVELVLPGTYYLIRMLDGRIDTQGTVKDLMLQGILEDIKHDATVEAVAQEQQVIDVDEIIDASTEEPTATQAIVKKPRQLVKEEYREVGSVKWEVYKTYIKASSYLLWGFVLFFVVLSQCATVGEKWWIKKWGEAYPLSSNLTILARPQLLVMDYNMLSMSYLPSYLQSYPAVLSMNTRQFQWPDAHEDPSFYIGIYAAIGMGTAFTRLLATAIQLLAAILASQKLYERLLTCVVKATMRWYDITPQGRILNRFGKDIETIDSNIADSLSNVNFNMVGFMAALLTVAFFFPWFIIPAVLLALTYRHMAISYLNTGRDLRRMESTTRSPIFSDFAEVLDGIVTVRAFSAERRFLRNLHRKIDETTRMYYFTWMTNRWLLFNFDCLSSFAVFITTLFALSGYASAGTAGLCITSSMTFTASIYWVCRYWTSLELDLNSVERVVEYLNVPEEPPSIIEDRRPPAYWPSKTSGAAMIAVEDLTIKYSPELPSVLHNISFSVNARERIGLLGRTGSGKSTLAMSLLRFVDPHAGRILIDGIDISTIGTRDLRSRVTFIPQDATLFSGTLRDNLDPFCEHDDAECLDVLHRVHLISKSVPATPRISRSSSASNILLGASTSDSMLSATPTNIDAKVTLSLGTLVSPGGSNFSQGQRQLIAMARALLRRSSIIILDEATSSIDFETDAKIQATIREEFNDSLLLTVAHRLRTVIDYDRLIVLDNGQIAEFDTPYNLIQKDGTFRDMCLKSGSFKELEESAKRKLSDDSDCF